MQDDLPPNALAQIYPISSSQSERQPVRKLLLHLDFEYFGSKFRLFYTLWSIPAYIFSVTLTKWISLNLCGLFFTKFEMMIHKTHKYFKIMSGLFLSLQIAMFPYVFIPACVSSSMASANY